MVIINDRGSLTADAWARKICTPFPWPENIDLYKIGKINFSKKGSDGDLGESEYKDDGHGAVEENPSDPGHRLEKPVTDVRHNAWVRRQRWTDIIADWLIEWDKGYKSN